MEQLNLTLTAIDAEQNVPSGGQYVFILTIWGDLHYGFWHTLFKKFYWMGDSAEREEVKCWYEVPKQFPVAKG